MRNHEGMFSHEGMCSDEGIFNLDHILKTWKSAMSELSSSEPAGTDVSTANATIIAIVTDDGANAN